MATLPGLHICDPYIKLKQIPRRERLGMTDCGAGTARYQTRGLVDMPLQIRRITNPEVCYVTIPRFGFYDATIRYRGKNPPVG